MNFRHMLIIMVLIVSSGCIGYSILEGYSFIDSLFMTVITLATVGYREIEPLSTPGKIFTIILIISGIGYFGYAVSQIIAFIVNGQLKDVFREKKMNKHINQMQDHFIVCGFGRVGKEVSRYLKEEDKSFIVIEKDLDKIQEALKLGFLAIFGDASDEIVLSKAEISKAKGVIITFDNTSENVYVILTVREMQENIMVVANGTNERSEKILYRAGADKVISPAQIGGRKMVSIVCHNPALDLVVKLVEDKKIDIKFAEAQLGRKCSIIGNTLAESNLRKKTNGIMVIGIKPIDGEVILNPLPEYVFKDDDKLIILGNNQQIDKLTEIIKSTEIKIIEN